jgi:hypothetical protein
MSSFSGKQSPKPSDPHQERVSERLDRLVGPGPAAFWCDACRLLNGDKLSLELDSATHLVAHLLREIERSLRDAISTSRHSVSTGQARESADCPGGILTQASQMIEMR